MKTVYQPYLSKVNKVLKELPYTYAFVGGMVVSLYGNLDIPVQSRSTEDLDCVINIASRGKYFLLQDQLRALNFKEDSSEGAPICRWIYKSLRVDIMPIDGDILGFSNIWYEEGLSSTIFFDLFDGSRIPIFKFVYFLAAKIEAMNNRNNGVDLRWNHDFEDILFLIVHRKDIISEIDRAETNVKAFIVENFLKLMKTPLFLKEAIQANMDFKGYVDAHFDQAFERVRSIANLY